MCSFLNRVCTTLFPTRLCTHITVRKCPPHFLASAPRTRMQSPCFSLASGSSFVTAKRTGKHGTKSGTLQLPRWTSKQEGGSTDKGSGSNIKPTWNCEASLVWPDAVNGPLPTRRTQVCPAWIAAESAVRSRDECWPITGSKQRTGQQDWTSILDLCSRFFSSGLAFIRDQGATGSSTLSPNCAAGCY